MNNLLRANFLRLFKDKIFWLCAAFMILFGAFFPLKIGSDVELTNFFFVYTVVIGILASVFCSLFLGTEYSDGVLRNKLVVGHTKSAVYLSNLIACSVGSLLLCCMSILPMCALGIPLHGAPANVPAFLFLLLVSLMMTVACAALFTLLGMLVSSKANAAVVCILCAIALLALAVIVNSRLEEPEFYEGYSITTSDGTVQEDTTPNPNYLTGVKRQVYEFFFDLLPAGQAIALTTCKAAHPVRMLLCSFSILAVTTACGLLLFRRKDIK